jgi:hypothetical protein
MLDLLQFILTIYAIGTMSVLFYTSYRIFWSGQDAPQWTLGRDGVRDDWVSGRIACWPYYAARALWRLRTPR